MSKRSKYEEVEVLTELPPQVAPVETNHVMVEKPIARALTQTSIDQSTEEGRKNAYALSCATAIPFKDVKDQFLTIKQYVVFPGEIFDEITGEQRMVQWLHMHLTDGRVISTTSPFVIRDLVGYQLNVMGGKWAIPITFVAREIPKRKGMGVYYRLETPLDSMNDIPQTRTRQPKEEAQSPVA